MHYILYNYHNNVLLICYSISELSNYNSLAAVGLVAVGLCEISMMICEIASVNAKRRCYFDRILSSLFRRLALGIIILIFIEQCPFLDYVCRVDIRRFECCRFGRRCSY